MLPYWGLRSKLTPSSNADTKKGGLELSFCSAYFFESNAERLLQHSSTKKYFIISSRLQTLRNSGLEGRREGEREGEM